MRLPVLPSVHLGAARACAAAAGKLLWDANSGQAFATAKGVAAHRGSLDGPGAAPAGGPFCVVSGNAMWNEWMPGKVLTARSSDGH